MKHRLLLLALAALFAACGGNAVEATSTSESPTTNIEDTTTTTTEPTTTSLGGGGDECLVGTWEASTEALLEAYESVMADVGLVVAGLDGDVRLQINSDGSSEFEFDGLEITAEMEETQFVVTLNGTSTASWAADGGVITTTSGQSDITVGAFFRLGDELFDAGEFPLEEGLEPEGGSASYSCDGDTLTMVPENESSVFSEFHRVG